MKLFFALLMLVGGMRAEDKILRVSEVDLRNAATYKVEPEYPAVARQLRVTGGVELEVVVDPAGAVDKVRVVSGNTLLVGSSMQAIKRWKFKPFEAEGQTVRAIGPVKFSFQI